MANVVYVTKGLLEVLLELAADAEPESISVSLSATPAEEIEDGELPSETPVLTDFYLPDTGKSIEAVFGVDLSTPTGQTHAKFLSHPAGDRELSRTDDLHAIVLVAVPPWDIDEIVAFDRHGRRQPLEILDVPLQTE